MNPQYLKSLRSSELKNCLQDLVIDGGDVKDGKMRKYRLSLFLLISVLLQFAVCRHAVYAVPSGMNSQDGIEATEFATKSELKAQIASQQAQIASQQAQITAMEKKLEQFSTLLQGVAVGSGPAKASVGPMVLTTSSLNASKSSTSLGDNDTAWVNFPGPVSIGSEPPGPSNGLTYTDPVGFGSIGLELDGDQGISTFTPTNWAGSTPLPRFRLSRPSPDPANPARPANFLITPYEYGMAFEYPGAAEWWVGEFSVHNYTNGPGGLNGAVLWVDDDVDMGGLFFTGRQLPDGTQWAEIASQRLDFTSHGPLFFRVVQPSDRFSFRQGTDGYFQNSSTEVFGIDGYGRVYFLNGANAYWNDTVGNQIPLINLQVNNTVNVGAMEPTATNGYLLLYAAGSEKARIDPSGDLTIWTGGVILLSPNGIKHRITVNNDGTISAVMVY